MRPSTNSSPTLQGQLADVQVLPGDDQRPGGGGHNDAALVKALHILHAGDGEMLPARQLQPVAGVTGILNSLVMDHPSLSTVYADREGDRRTHQICRYRAAASLCRTVSCTDSTSTVMVRAPKRREI